MELNRSFLKNFNSLGNLPQIFLKDFTIMHVASSLHSFDDNQNKEKILQFMELNSVDVVGIRRNGVVTGYVEKVELKENNRFESFKEITNSFILQDSIPLFEVIQAMDQHKFVFVSILGQVAGIVTRNDLQKPAVRMWLFGIITLIEMTFTKAIPLFYPNDSWLPLITESRLQKAQALFLERQHLKQSIELIDCIQLADKSLIIFNKPEIFESSPFSSKRKAKQAIHDLEILRNQLAHSQDIITDTWETIVYLTQVIKPLLYEDTPLQKFIAIKQQALLHH